MTKLILPRTYESDKEEFQKYVGLPKLSYSQINSWNEKLYKADYIKQYFFGLKTDSGAYAHFGTACGEYLEHMGQKLEYTNQLLNADDIKTLDGLVDEDAVYEDEIVHPVTDSKGKILFCIQGFIDKAKYEGKKELSIIDFKTANNEKKRKFYAGVDYNQTILYAGAKEAEGFKIKNCGVIMMDRVGNAFRGQELHLSGKTEVVDTPYTKAKFNTFIKYATKTAKEISAHYQVLLKVRGELK